MDMGIEEFLISSTLLGVLAQRLTRQLCPTCKAPTELPRVILDDLKLPEGHIYYKANGCKECDYTGYRGRRAVGELFIMDDDVKMMMKDGV